MTGRGWLVAVLTATAALAFLALHGPDRQSSLQVHKALGPLRDVDAARVVAVRIAAGDRHWLIERHNGHWTAEPAPALEASELAKRIDTAFRLLRNAPPEREFEAASPAFGLEPAALAVAVYAFDGEKPTPVLEIAFGAVNPIGGACYARIHREGHSRIVLMPTYVAESWRQVVGLP